MRFATQAAATPYRMHPYVVRRLPVAPRPRLPERETAEPPSLAQVIPFRLKPWRERNLHVEVLQQFREARFGDT